MGASTTEQHPAASARGQTLAELDAVKADALALKADVDRLVTPSTTGLRPKEVLQIFAAVDGAAKAAEASSKVLKDVRSSLEEAVLGALDDMGLQRAPLQGGPTIYRARELWAGVEKLSEDEDTDEAYRRVTRAMRRIGDLKPYVQERFNVQSLSAWFRAREKEEEARVREAAGLPPDEPVAIDPETLIPRQLRGKIKLTEKVYPKAVKG